MKITDAILSYLLKGGVVYEGRLIDTEIEIPFEDDEKQKTVKIAIKCEHMTIRINKENKDEA